MISQKAHSLLSELHKLLAGYESSDFKEAASFSPQLREGLIFLSTRVGIKNLEPIALHSSSSEEATEQPDSKEPSSSKIPRYSARKMHTAQDVSNFLSRSGQVESAGQIVALARRLNLPLKSNEKDGKARLLSRLSGLISNLPRERKESVAREVSQMSTSQTQGWVDVLKGSR